MAKKADDAQEKETVKGKSNVIKIEFSEQEKANAELAKGRLTEYEVPEGEENVVHVELEKTHIGRDFKKSSYPYVCKVNTNQWPSFKANLIKSGFNHVRVLFAPEGVNTEIPA